MTTFKRKNYGPDVQKELKYWLRDIERNLGMGTKISLIARADWANIPFVDESKIKLQSSDGEEGCYKLER